MMMSHGYFLVFMIDNVLLFIVFLWLLKQAQLFAKAGAKIQKKSHSAAQAAEFWLAIRV
jgi:hypothetical protein